jgi:beta-glucanase (GH16 family)
MVIKESLKDLVLNTFLYIKSLIRSFFNKRKKSNSNITFKMELIFEDNFQSFNKDFWRIGQPWGEFHPENPYQYYGKDSVFIKDNCLILNQIYSPKQLSTWDDSSKVYNISYSVGLVTSFKSFEYGFYEFEVELPYGVGLWPAVWLSCVDSWPPEIDIFEGYSDSKSDYKSNLQSNFHFNMSDKKESSGARNHSVNNSYDKLKLGCWWSKDFIKIYYNGYLVRQITSDNILKWFRGKKMMIILNHAIRPEHTKRVKSQISEFKTHSVKVWE